MSASLVLLDGSGFLFRAYYGLPELTNAEGQQIHAVYGFLRMVFKLLDSEYTHLLIARDSPVKTLRHIAFEEYKANRTAIPDEFKAQIRMTKDLIKELAIPALEIPGYEADDIIGTLATHYAKDPSVEVAIASGDKDLKQLITHNIIHTDPMKQVVTTKESFFDEFGFEPIYLVDYLAIV
jgi:DNA polymerase-1